MEVGTQGGSEEGEKKGKATLQDKGDHNNLAAMGLGGLERRASHDLVPVKNWGGGGGGCYHFLGFREPVRSKTCLAVGRDVVANGGGKSLRKGPLVSDQEKKEWGQISDICISAASCGTAGLTYWLRIKSVLGGKCINSFQLEGKGGEGGERKWTEGDPGRRSGLEILFIGKKKKKKGMGGGGNFREKEKGKK